eukprot:1159095-Pelagomonas_calceolata.AAC.8
MTVWERARWRVPMRCCKTGCFRGEDVVTSSDSKSSSLFRDTPNSLVPNLMHISMSKAPFHFDTKSIHTVASLGMRPLMHLPFMQQRYLLELTPHSTKQKNPSFI